MGEEAAAQLIIWLPCKCARVCFGSEGHWIVCFPFVVSQFNLLLIIKSGTYLALKPQVIEKAWWHARPFQRVALEKAEGGVKLSPVPGQEHFLKTEFTLLLAKPTTRSQGVSFSRIKPACIKDRLRSLDRGTKFKEAPEIFGVLCCI